MPVHTDLHKKLQEAFQISKQMMDGQKGDAFVLDLSFIGWEFLSFITLGIVQISQKNRYNIP